MCQLVMMLSAKACSLLKIYEREDKIIYLERLSEIGALRAFKDFLNICKKYENLEADSLVLEVWKIKISKTGRSQEVLFSLLVEALISWL